MDGLLVGVKDTGNSTLRYKVNLTDAKSISSGAQYVTVRKYISHPSLVMYSFATPPIKLKLVEQIGGGLLIANRLDQLLWWANQKNWVAIRSYLLRPEWTRTHQCTNVDGWCIHGRIFFIPPCPWANQGGKLKLTFFFFPFLSPGRFFFGELFFLLTPHMRPGLTYRPLHYCLCTLASSLPHLPTYLPTYSPIYLPSHQPIYLCTKSPPRQWRCKSMKVLQYTR